MAKKIDLNGLDHFKDKENAMIAADYSATKTYAVGDYVYYNGTLYRCTTAITTAEAWTVGHWTAAKLADDLTAQSEAITELSTAVDEIKDEVEDYPQKTKTITIDDFVQGYRHNQTGAAVKNDSGYTTTATAIDFKSGDVFVHPTDQGVAYYFVATDGTFYQTYVASGYTFAEDKTLYIDCGKSGITPQTTPDCTYTRATIITPIAEQAEGMQAQIDYLLKSKPVFEICQKQGDASVKRGYHVRSGSETSTYDYFCCTDYFECKSGDVFLILNGNSVSRYTPAKVFTSMTECSEMPLYSGGQRWNIWISDTTGYVRFTLYWTEPVMCAVTKVKVDEYPYTCVSLGDSIFGNNQKPNDLPTYMQEVCKLMSANCGFGGTMAATHYTAAYTPLSFWSIADAINSGDWTDIDVDWNEIGGDHVFMANVYILCHLIDWSKVRIMTVAYGINDWNGNVTIDNLENAYDVTTYKGALRYGIEKIQSAYPKINIILLSPLYRYWSESQDYSTVDEDSDTKQNGGRLLTEYVEAMKDVAEEYHLPFYDNYNTAGINKKTAPSILRDGTHLNYLYGVEMVGKHIGAEVAMSRQFV